MQTAGSSEIPVGRVSEVPGDLSSAMNVCDPVSADADGLQTTSSGLHATVVGSEPAMTDTRCSYCKCLKYFNFQVLGIPVYFTYRTAKKAIGFVDDIFALDQQGNIVVQEGARVA